MQGWQQRLCSALLCSFVCVGVGELLTLNLRQDGWERPRLVQTTEVDPLFWAFRAFMAGRPACGALLATSQVSCQAKPSPERTCEFLSFLPCPYDGASRCPGCLL